MLSSPIVPADTVLPAHYFLYVLTTPTALTSIRLTLSPLALALLATSLYTRKESRKEAPPRN